MKLRPTPYAASLSAFGISPDEWDRFRLPFAEAHLALGGQIEGAATCACGAPMLVGVQRPEACRVLWTLASLAGAAEPVTRGGDRLDVLGALRLLAMRANQDAGEERQ